MRKPILSLLVVMILVAISSVIGIYCRTNAFVYISLVWFTVCIVISVASRATLRLLALYAASVILAFGLCEAYVGGWFSKPHPSSGNISYSNRTYYQNDPTLGYVPQKNTSTLATKQYENEVLYDVKYTIDPYGLRVGLSRSKHSKSAVLFFGGSFTFGEGVNDEETLPYRFEIKSDKKFVAFNFGFHGYGPHQMLAVLENEMERSAVGDNQPQYAIYQTIIPWHIYRATGRVHWGSSGPRYRLNDSGEAVSSGPFQNWFVSKLIKVTSRSRLIRRLLSKRGEISPSDIELFVSILKKSERIFRNRYGGKFFVLLWPGKNTLNTKVLSKLREAQINVIVIENILSDYKNNIEKYTIHFPYEKHPNALAYDMMAEYLATLLKTDVAADHDLKHRFSPVN